MTDEYKIDPDKARVVDCQVDTVGIESDVGGLFSSDVNTVTIHHRKDDSDFNKWSEGPQVLQHEQKHRDNELAGMYAYAISREQAYKLNMHDEISANIASLLSLREEYLKTGDISIFEKSEYGCFSFYGEAIKRGEINPKSEYKEDFDKEMRFIANQTQKMWMDDFSGIYLGPNSSYAMYYGETNGTHKEYYEQNYERGKKIAYTMGGIDFSKYLENDVEIPEAGKEDIGIVSDYRNKINSGNKINSNDKTQQELAEMFKVPAFDGSMSLRQYKSLVQHTLATRDKWSGINSDLPSHEEPFKTRGEMNAYYVGMYYLIGDDTSRDYEKALSQNYAETMSENEKIADELTRKAAQEYYDNGKDLPKDNDKAYNEAMDKLFTKHLEYNESDLKYKGDVNLRKVFDPDNKYDYKNTTLSQSASEIENDCKSLTAWGKFTKKTEIFWEKTKSKVKSFFSKEDKNEVEKKTDNAAVRGIVTESTYRKWEDKDGSRVSDVQHREVLDLTKNVIKQPTKSRAAEQKKAQESKKGQQAVNGKNALRDKMVRALDYMNKVNGVGKEVNSQEMVDKLVNVYGDDAYPLLMKAINEPSNYAKIVKDDSIKTSRLALQHLCSVEDSKKTADIVMQDVKANNPEYIGVVKKTVKHTATKAPIKKKMSEDSNKAKKIMLNLDKAKVKQAENYVAVQDNTRVVRPVTPTRKITRER